MKKLIYLVPLIIIVLIASMGILAIFKLQKEQDLSAKFENQEIVDLPAFSFKNLDENQPDLTDKEFRKKKYSVLNVFASWCLTCAAEHKVLLELSKNKNINLFGVAYHDIDQNTKDYLAKNKNPYQKVGVDKKGEMAKLLAVSGIPETFIINDRGQIIYRFKGNLPQEIVAFFKQ